MFAAANSRGRAGVTRRRRPFTELRHKPEAANRSPRTPSARIIAGTLCLVCLVFAAAPSRAQGAATADSLLAPPRADSSPVETRRANAMAEEFAWLKAERMIITSASRHDEELFKTSAAVYVVTSDDIRRSGARTLPDVFRLVPGMGVAQMDANKWAISSRGFNSRFADKLLVLIDGRSVYTPSFSGVYWDMQDYLLEDIERIEVIRGPGGTLWGANAVNGVINIMTKAAKRTQDGILAAGYGSEERGAASLRQSTKLGESGDLRGFAKVRKLDDLPGGFDGWDMVQGGFRADWSRGPTSFTLQGDAYRGNERQQLVTARLPAVPYAGAVVDTLDESFRVDGQNIVFRIEHELGMGSNWQLQAYWDRTNRTDRGMSAYRNTIDVDFQHRFALTSGHDVTYGTGYRYLPDHFRNPDPGYIVWDPADRDWQLFSAFVQDEIAPVKGRWRLTLGSKFEHNDFTGFEIQPNVRLAVTPNDRATIWGAVSRAVQVPGRNLDAVRSLVQSSTAAAPLTIVGVGSQAIEATELIAYEVGHRWSPSEVISTDITLFYNNYDKFVDGLPSADLAAGILYVTAVNAGSGSSHGGEASMVWRASRWCRLVAAYSYQKVAIRGLGNALFAEGRDPNHQGSLRSSFNLAPSVDLDLMGRYTSELPSYALPGRFEMDARLGWRPTSRVEIDFVGKNLAAPRHVEFGEDQVTPTLVNPVRRSVFGRASLHF